MQTRRGFLMHASLAGAAVALGSSGSARAALHRGGAFPEGVLSGDPAATSITLLTRAAGVEEPGSVRLEVARDSGFDRVVRRVDLLTEARFEHVVKYRVRGLRPDERYWYRFATRDAGSRVGQFKTPPPADSQQRRRVAVVTAPGAAARIRDPLDLVVQLGGYGEAPLESTLAGHRAAYRRARRNAALREAHARVPVAAMWDHVEAASPQAFFEHMPTFGTGPQRTRLYRSLTLGRALEIVLLDCERYRPAVLGEAQGLFLRRRLLRSRAAWLLIGIVTPLGDEQGWAEAPQERRDLLEFIRLNTIHDVASVSRKASATLARDVRSGDGTAVVHEFGLDASRPGHVVLEATRRELNVQVGGSRFSIERGRQDLGMAG